MTSYGPGEARAPGARREKMKGYLRAANELRQNYQSNLAQRMAADEEAVPGSFPDVEIVRSGDEEMLLFPSYARKHLKRQSSIVSVHQGQPGTQEHIERPRSIGDADYWKSEWERYEDANAVVDVDVRGWIYSPQKGPLNRKNRLLIAVARKLSGIPAPAPSPTVSRAPSQHHSHHDRVENRTTRHEEEVAAKEAENIARRGQEEVDAASRGSYSAEAVKEPNSKSASPAGSRSSSPSSGIEAFPGHMLDSEEEDPGLRALAKRQSWHEPSHMGKEDLLKANELLMARLKPFMNLPLASTTITVFFFNSEKSRSKSVRTNDSGHFNVRAALDFVPTNVRVLASENLSATEEVHITEAKGISLVSDIDDTIKHSAISHGAREIFKNTFIRELGDLTIDGVREWYSKLSGLGVQMHYVSNSPWQLYPLLRSYFSLAGLPAGSFHLKQYTGMLQGIFEPAAERKKGSLDRIMSDFPERKFILVGDSGEADLEVYTDVVTSNPGRVLAVFIRDVTTPHTKGFFDQAMSNTVPDSMASFKNGDHRPAYPARSKTETEGMTQSPEQEDLIDFSEGSELDPMEVKPSTYSEDLKELHQPQRSNTQALPPGRPAKPSNLRHYTVRSPTPTNHERITGEEPTSPIARGKKHLSPPPKPRRPSNAVQIPPSLSPTLEARRPAFSSTDGLPTAVPPARPTYQSRTTSHQPQAQNSNEDGYLTSARRQLASAYNALPPLRSSSRSPSRDRHGHAQQHNPDGTPRPLGPRRGLTSYPAAAARWATGADATPGTEGVPGHNKKEEFWRRRWTRAEGIMRSHGVVLRSWRVGGDVMNECCRMVTREMRRGAVDYGEVEGEGEKEGEKEHDHEHEHKEEEKQEKQEK